MYITFGPDHRCLCRIAVNITAASLARNCLRTSKCVGIRHPRREQSHTQGMWVQLLWRESNHPRIIVREDHPPEEYEDALVCWMEVNSCCGLLGASDMTHVNGKWKGEMTENIHAALKYLYVDHRLTTSSEAELASRETGPRSWGSQVALAPVPPHVTPFYSRAQRTLRKVCN